MPSDNIFFFKIPECHKTVTKQKQLWRQRDFFAQIW